MLKRILSVGIDIGTSTTQVIFSNLSMENTSGFFTVPKISIVGKEIIYKGGIHITPLKSDVLIDGEAVREIVSYEYKKAGFSPSDVDTGAVIITGESARKENSEEVLRYLSSFAGEFVVSTAGPDMESVIAGKGSGAAQYSADESCAVVNLDIGGGTTNVAVFDDGEVMSVGCLDIGGRLIRFDESRRISYLSDSAKKAAQTAGVSLSVGDTADEASLRKICDVYAKALEQLLGIAPDDGLADIFRSSGSSDFVLPKRLRAVCFSGGVADFIYDAEGDKFRFSDIGVLLGEAILRSRICREFRLIGASETIRATVIGAGTYTTSVSGSTIDYTDGLFPLKNIPVMKLSDEEQDRCFSGDSRMLREKFSRFLSQNDCRNAVLSMDGEANPSYIAVKKLAKTISDALCDVLPRSEAIMIVLRHDMAKILGRLIREEVKDRPVVSIDSVVVQQGDYIDMGKPLMEGMVIPVVVKTLIFG